MSMAEPMIVGSKQKMMGIIRSFCHRLNKKSSTMDELSHTFLSEYHPQASVVNDATAPPGVDRIRVCLDLREALLNEIKQ